MSRRYIALTLLVAFTLKLCAAWLIHLWQIQSIHAYQQEKIESGDFNGETIAHLVVDREMISWVEENEFVFEGYLYDVINLVEHDGYLSIAAIKDHKETEQDHNYKQNQNQQQKEEGGRNELQTTTIPFTIPAYLRVIFEQSSRLLTALPVDNMQTNFTLKVLAPPPRA